MNFSRRAERGLPAPRTCATISGQNASLPVASVRRVYRRRRGRWSCARVSYNILLQCPRLYYVRIDSLKYISAVIFSVPGYREFRLPSVKYCFRKKKYNLKKKWFVKTPNVQDVVYDRSQRLVQVPTSYVIILYPRTGELIFYFSLTKKINNYQVRSLIFNKKKN